MTRTADQCLADGHTVYADWSEYQRHGVSVQEGEVWVASTSRSLDGGDGDTSFWCDDEDIEIASPATFDYA